MILNFDIPSFLQKIAIMAIPVVFAITSHEAAHGWVAYKFGDPTAKLQGRLSLNPLVHIDIFGTVILPILMLAYAQIIIGYAKPVPVNFLNLRNPRRDIIWVSAAGPGINIALAFGCGILLRILSLLSHEVISNLGLFSFILRFIMLMLEAGIIWNVVLAIFNLIPIPPLDGGRILVGLLPRKQADALSKIEPYGFLIIMFLVFMNPLGFMTRIIWPIMTFFTSILAWRPLF